MNDSNCSLTVADKTFARQEIVNDVSSDALQVRINDEHDMDNNTHSAGLVQCQRARFSSRRSIASFKNNVGRA